MRLAASLPSRHRAAMVRRLLASPLLACGGVLAAYDESRALEYAKLAGAAYCSQSSLESWSCGASRDIYYDAHDTR